MAIKIVQGVGLWTYAEMKGLFLEFSLIKLDFELDYLLFFIIYVIVDRKLFKVLRFFKVFFFASLQISMKLL